MPPFEKGIWAKEKIQEQPQKIWFYGDLAFSIISFLRASLMFVQQILAPGKSPEPPLGKSSCNQIIQQGYNSWAHAQF